MRAGVAPPHGANLRRISFPCALLQLQFTVGPVSTKDLTRSFGWDTADAFQQHDVQELNRILCDRLEEKMKVRAEVGWVATEGGQPGGSWWGRCCFAMRHNLCACALLQGTRVEGMINKLFEGHTLNYLECINVEYKSSRKESFMDVQVRCPAGSNCCTQPLYSQHQAAALSWHSLRQTLWAM